MRHGPEARPQRLVLHREKINLDEVTLHQRTQSWLCLAVNVLLTREFGSVHLRFKTRAPDDAGPVLRERGGDTLHEIILLACVDMLKDIERVGRTKLTLAVFSLNRIPVLKIGLH